MPITLINTDTTTTVTVDDNDEILVTQGTTIATGGDAIVTLGDAGVNGGTDDGILDGVSFTLLGTIFAGGAGMDFFDNLGADETLTDFDITIGATGSIYAQSIGMSLEDGDNQRITNHGTINSAETSAVFTGGAPVPALTILERSPAQPDSPPRPSL